MENNTPYGFEDPGINYKYSGPASKSDYRKFRAQFSHFPDTPNDADIAMNVIRKHRKSIDVVNSDIQNEK